MPLVENVQCGSLGVTSDTSKSLERLIARYDKTRKALTVNFRQLVPWMSMGERATHYIHPYPAKLLPQIPAFFLSNTLLSVPKSVVLDPFCGSGTVLLESIIHGRSAIGADSNPLARLITTAKVTTCSIPNLRRDLAAILEVVGELQPVAIPDMVNLDYWFYPHVLRNLAALRAAVETI